MGQKRTWKRKHLFFQLTGGIIISWVLFGCAGYQEFLQEQEQRRNRNSKIPEISQQIYEARYLMAAGEFEASLAKSEETLKRYPRAYGDQALFQMGLVMAHPNNPHSDARISIGYFQTLQDKFQTSGLSPEAGVWINILQEYIRQNMELAVLYDNFNNQTEKLTHNIANLKSTLRKKKNQIRIHRQQIANVTAEVEKLQKQIAMLKEVDIRIEEKKRKIKND